MAQGANDHSLTRKFPTINYASVIQVPPPALPAIAAF